MSSGESTTVARALRVLEELSQEADGLSISEIARRLNVPRAPLYRVIQALANARFVRRGDGLRYFLGVGLLPIAAATPNPLDLVRSHLQELADAVGASVLFIVDREVGLETLMCVSPSAPGEFIVVQPGFVLPRNQTGPPQVALLASQPEHHSDSDLVRRARELGYSEAGDRKEGSRFGMAAVVDLRGIGEVGCILVVTLKEVDPVEINGPLLAAAKAISLDLGV